MKSKRTWVLEAAVGVALPALWIVGLADASAAPPRAASSTVTRTGPNGNSSSFNTSVQATGNGGYNRSATRTGPAGNTVTTQGQGSYNASTGTYNQSRTTTGPNGNSATTNRAVSVGTPQ
jgi:hypothetical protein